MSRNQSKVFEASRLWLSSMANSATFPCVTDKASERRKTKKEKPISGDFLEHPGSAGEMHFSYESRKDPTGDKIQPAKSILDITRASPPSKRRA
jgi:hypothetical protein